MKNQRKTSFSSNHLVPDLNVFTEGPGVGKYSAAIGTIGKSVIESTIETQPQYSIPKAVRPVTQPTVDTEEQTPGPGHYELKLKSDKIPGHYSFAKPKEKSGTLSILLRIRNLILVFSNFLKFKYTPNRGPRG